LPIVTFEAEAEQCPNCNGGLEFHNSHTRDVVTLAQGAFRAREVLKRCESGASCSVVRSAELSRLVKPRHEYGYDVMVQVGLARYLDCKQREEIQTELLDRRGIEPSTGTMSNLCDRFLVYLEALHLYRVPALRAAMEGGYPLHIDATCDRGRGGPFICMDGWRDWVLLAGRIPSENETVLKPLVDKTVALFGDPLATFATWAALVAVRLRPSEIEAAPT